jgi:23S rRNA pseudouridine2605 synthase
VNRLIRVAVGDLVLGELPKGAWRPLTPAEVSRLRG